MEWFSNWWQTLNFIEQVLYCIAIPATLILLIQTILLIVGIGGSGEGIDISDTSGLDTGDFGGIDGDAFDFDSAVGDVDIDTGGADGGDGFVPHEMGLLSLFTMQGIVSFFCIFSWSAIILVAVLNTLFALAIAFVLGFLSMAGVAQIIRLSSKLAQNGTLNMKVLLGETGTVYLPIPANGKGHGKVYVQLSERFIECDALCESEKSLPTNTTIRVVDILAGNVLVVEQLNS